MTPVITRAALYRTISIFLKIYQMFCDKLHLYDQDYA